jgi:hypothetical protein
MSAFFDTPLSQFPNFLAARASIFTLNKFDYQKLLNWFHNYFKILTKLYYIYMQTTIFIILTTLALSFNFIEKPPRSKQQVTFLTEDTLKKNKMTIEYFLSDTTYYISKDLYAKIDGKIYTLVDSSENICVGIKDIRDYNNDGIEDVLVALIHGCGGNCCGNSYFFISYINGKFIRTKEVAYGNMSVIEKWKEQWSFVSISNNEGVNTMPPEEVTERFILVADSIVRVEIYEPKKIEAVVEMRSDEFDWNEDEERTLLYDIDGDGKLDKIIGSLWHRWGRIFWRIEFANGKNIDGTKIRSPKRIGVLANSTNKFRDIVLDIDVIIRWNGNKYE